MGNESGFSDLYAVKGNRIVCQLCRHYCQLLEGQIGICGVNQNVDGRLKNLVYGKVSALNIDPVEKKPLYHFLPGSSALSLGTVGCNMKCPFCQNWQISQTKEIADSHDITPEQLIAIAVENGCRSIAYTYNEPTIFYPFAKEIAVLAKSQGIKNIFVSNGLETKELIEDMRGIIDGFNIDIKSFNHEYYKKSLGGSLEDILDTLRLLRKNNFWIEVTTLIVPEDNDRDEELGSIAKFIAEEMGIYTPWHISAFVPNYKAKDKLCTTPEALQKAREIGYVYGLKYVYMGNIKGKSITYCPDCKGPLIVRREHSVVQNRLSDGRCPDCKREIEGIWR